MEFLRELRESSREAHIRLDRSPVIRALLLKPRIEDYSRLLETLGGLLSLCELGYQEDPILSRSFPLMIHRQLWDSEAQLLGLRALRLRGVANCDLRALAYVYEGSASGGKIVAEQLALKGFHGEFGFLRRSEQEKERWNKFTLYLKGLACDAPNRSRIISDVNVVFDAVTQAMCEFNMGPRKDFYESAY